MEYDHIVFYTSFDGENTCIRTPAQNLFDDLTARMMNDRRCLQRISWLFSQQCV